MNVEALRRIMRDRHGVDATTVTAEELVGFEAFLGVSDIADYLYNCLPAEPYTASGVGVKTLSLLRDENLGEATPGMYIYPSGYMVIATSIGGNAVCVHVSGRVFWADHASFADDLVSFEDRETGEWVDLPATQDSISKAMVLLSSDFESFVQSLLKDEVTGTLEELDH